LRVPLSAEEEVENAGLTLDVRVEEKTMPIVVRIAIAAQIRRIVLTKVSKWFRDRNVIEIRPYPQAIAASAEKRPRARTDQLPTYIVRE
jgi:hypothetical protein